MTDINSNVRLDIDGSGALATLKELQRQISVFQSAMAKGNAANRTAASNLQKDLINNINATGQFAASMKDVRTGTEQFTTALEKNKLSLGEYFRYGMGSTKTFGRMFKTEMATVEKVARERVKTIQTQYIKLGRDANGAMKSIAVRPLALDMGNLATKTAIAAQKQQIFNQVLKQGSTNLLNFGKNTQWAGRQLMVGFTIPLTMFATTAGKAFMDMEKQIIRLRRVYGDFNTTVQQTDAMVESVRNLANEFTKYGVAVEKTMGLAADAAAMGKQGADLTAQVTEATRLAVLGGVEQAQALETTISLTNAFGTAADKLAGKINFLNSVENQTVTSIEDLTIAIPKAGPVVQQLGGDVEDLAFFLTAMREGGINASEGANALKSGLASLINPTAKASEFLQGFGINIKSIVESNKGDISGLVVDFASALDTLDPLNRARAIEQLFGKFQFSRLSTLFQNVIKDGTQASQVLKLTRNSTEELAIVAERELKKLADSPLTKFQKSVEDLKASLIPLGEQFIKIATPIIEFATKALKEFSKLDEGAKGFVVAMTAGLGLIGPVAIMTFGLLANGVANIIKGFAAMRNVFLKLKGGTGALGESVSYLTQEQLEALSVSASLNAAHQKLRQTYTSEKNAVDNLTAAYVRATTAQAGFAVPATKRSRPTKKYASGVVSVPGPKGAGDIIPAMLAPGEAVIPAKMASKYSGLIQGMVAGSIPEFAKGFLGMPKSFKRVSKERENAKEIFDLFQQSKRFKDQAPENYMGQVKSSGGHSFPIFGLGGTYRKPDGSQVFVKPVMDEKAALAEVRATKIAREAHGLQSPEQRIVVMKDPTDRTGTRKFLALESPVDPKFATPTGKFTKKQYFQQLLASLVRGDKDLSADNVYGDVLPDVGTAGVFSRASGVRDYEPNMPSLEEQAKINLLAVKGGAKKAFAESTADMVRGMSAQEYSSAMRNEIEEVLPKLKASIKSMSLGPDELPYYEAMVKRLEDGRGVDWTKFHEIHSAVGMNPKQSKNVKKYNSGVVSVPGSGNKDTIPAMLTPGEAVIPKKYAKKYAPLINAMVDGKIPGFNGGLKATLQRSHLQEDLDLEDPKVRKMLAELGYDFGSMPKDVRDNMKLTGSLVADLPDRLNQKLRESGSGVSPDDFLRSWNAVEDKLAQTAMLGGVDMSSRENKDLLAQLEREIGQEVAKTARKEKSPIKDKLVARVTREVLERRINAGGPLASLASAIDSRRFVPGDLRSKYTHAEIDAELKSGSGKFTRVGSQVVETKSGITIGGYRARTGKFKQKTMGVAGSGGYFGKAKLGRVTDRDEAFMTYLDDSQSAKSAKATKTRASDKAAQDTVARSLNRSSKSRSPSKKMKQATDNIVDGVEEGLEDGKKAVKAAATRLGETAAQSFEDGGTKRVKLTQSGRYMNRDTGKFISKEEAKKLMGMDLKNARARERAAERKATPTVKIVKRKPRVASGTPEDEDAKKRGYRPSKVGMLGSSLGMGASMAGGAMGNEALMNAGNVAFLVSALADVAMLFKGTKVIDNVKNFGSVVKTAFGGAKAARGAGAVGKSAIAAGRAAAAQAGTKAATGIATRVGAGLAARLGASTLGGPAAPALAVGAVVLTGIQLGVELFNEKVRTTAEELRVFGDHMTTTGKEMESFAVATGQATPDAIMDRKNAKKFSAINYAAGKTPFGESFLQSEAGSAMLTKTAELAATDRKAAIEAVGKDLAYAVVSGLMTQEQANSVATALGKQMDDYTISVSLIGKLQEVVGFDGYDVTKNPIDIPVNLMITSNGKALTDVAGPLKDLINTETGFFDGVDAWADVQANEKDAAVAASELVNGAQLVLDLLDSEYLPKIEELNKKGKFAEADQLSSEYLSKRGVALKEYNSQYGSFLKSVQKMEGFKTAIDYDINGKQIAVASRDGKKQQNVEGIVENIQQNINTEFTGDENAPMRKFAEKIADDGQISGAAKISFMLNAKAGNIDPEKGLKLFEKGAIFDPNSPEGQRNQSAYVTIFTELGGRDAAQFSGILENLAAEGVTSATFIAQVQAKGKPEDKRDILNLYSLIDQYGGVINAEATYNFLATGDNLEDTLSKIDKLQKLADTGKLDIKSVLEQEIITDPNDIAAFKGNQEYFDSLDPVNKVLYLQTFMTVQYDTSQVDAYIKENTKNGTYTDKSTGKKINFAQAGRNSMGAVRALAESSMAQRDAELVTETNKLNNKNNNNNNNNTDGSGGPDSSWLDDYVRRAKNAFKWTQQLTTGFKASADALKKFKAASGGVGLEQYLRENLQSVGLSPEMVDIISNLSGDEQKEFVKRYFKGGQMSKGLNKDGESLVAFDRKLAIEETTDAYAKEAKNAQQAAKARDMLIAKGFSEADATELAADSQIAWALTSAKTTEEIDKQIAKIKGHIKTIQESKTVNQQFAEMFDEAMGIIGDRREAIEIKFEADTKALEDGIRKAQDQIDIIVNEPGGIDDLQYGLDQIGWQEDEINKKYDKRLDALDKVEQARKRAVQAQQAEFDLARAMASGDSSSAASAIQKFRADKASSAADNRRRMLEQARDTEIKNISVQVNGVKLTRDQIEQSILDKTKQIAKIEEDSIEPARYKIQLMEDARDDILSTLADQEIKWKLLDAQIKNAAYNAWDYAKAIGEANTLLGNTTAPASAPASTGTDNKAIQAEINELNRLIGITRENVANEKDAKKKAALIEINEGRIRKVRELTLKLNNNAAPAAPLKLSGGVSRTQYAATGGMIKYFANGGKPLGSDIVPAMLTPGEFVMSKYAVSSFGADNMKAINNGSYKNDSVYNYEVNINVKSDTNADQIARTVMMQIQQIDAQRVRGGRI